MKGMVAHRYIIIETRGKGIFLLFVGGFRELKNFFNRCERKWYEENGEMNEENLFTKRCIIIRLVVQDKFV